ncbi:hypothetical protein V6Z11_A03G188900 [Gossypium hirsutum]
MLYFFGKMSYGFHFCKIFSGSSFVQANLVLLH